MGLATFLDQEAEKSDSATKAGATIFPVVMSASKARQIAAELRAKDKEIEYQRGERETAQIELARLCTALDAAHAERDAAQKVITDAYNIMITPYHADATSDDATSQMVGEHQRVTEMLANALSSHPAAPAPTAQPAAVEADDESQPAPHGKLASVGTNQPTYNAFPHQYDDEMPDRGHTAYTLESAEDWCLQAIEQTDMRDNYNIEHEQAIQANTYAIQDIIGYLKSKGERQS